MDGGAAADHAATDELDLSGDDSLPWLEPGEEDAAAGTLDRAQVVGFAAILLVILAAAVGSVWYFGSRSGDGDVVADGSVIEAPAGPIKERPEDPGGKEFAGTGNVAPVVGEGGTPDGVMATEEGDGAAEAKLVKLQPADEPAQQPNEQPATSSGVAVQLAAYASRARAEQGWRDLTQRTEVLSGRNYRIERGVVDIGTVYRLQVPASDRAAADSLCEALRADGLDCQVKG
jgi:hypothetical protein